MFFIESRGNDEIKGKKIPFSEAILNPSASFGGLYVPEKLPKLNLKELQNLSYKDLALKVLKSFEIDISDEVILEALSLYNNFDNPKEPVPVKKITDNLFIAELYHGPTRAFKDMALQPFGHILSYLAKTRKDKYLILTATSGDTGPATLETFKNKENVQVICLYPKGGTSDVQRLQMVTEEGENLKVFGINGDFDDAQTALKSLLNSQSFKDNLSKKGIKLSAANSVNFGRIIFQTVYHIYSYLQLVNQKAINFGEKIFLTVPSGNFGNALGGFYAKEMGVPIEKIIITSNSNNILTDLINRGEYNLKNRDVINTKSPAMDILKSSNVERVLFHLFGATKTKNFMEQLEKSGSYKLNQDELIKLQTIFSASFSTDEESLLGIKEFFNLGYLLDPHTATIIKAHKNIALKSNLKNVAYSTAEWTKFSPSIVEALEGQSEISDREALEKIANLTDSKIPHQISKLFSKKIIHTEVIEKDKIEETLLNFLD